MKVFVRAACSAALAATAALAGCASSASTSLINLPDGQPGFAINCSGTGAGSSWAECYVQAGQACGPTGYEVVSKDNDGGAPTGGSINGVVAANIKNRSMVIHCK